MSTVLDSVSHERRLDYLARPKTNFLKYRDSIASPITPVAYCLSPRQEELAQPKPVRRMCEDRPSPIWPISPNALLAVPSPRLEQLAQAKTVSQEWKEDRSVYSIVSEGAEKASATPRTVHLAKPKNCATLPCTPNSHQEEGDGRSLSNKIVGPTARIKTLALPKTVPPQYQPNLPVLRSVPDSALHTQASDRVCQLAKPKPRKAVFEGYDPYRISSATIHAEASPRILELSTPPARRQQSKKI
ncbi:sperm microtubule associated protein 2 [Rhinophrynus dorsalis]